MPPNSFLPESNTSLAYTTPCSPPHLTHTPVPTPSPNELLIKVHAAAINPVDIQLWGNPVVGWLAGKKEKGIGRDYSGVIVAVGKEVKKQGRWEVGDEVFGLYNKPVRYSLLISHFPENSSILCPSKVYKGRFQFCISVPFFLYRKKTSAEITFHTLN